MTPPDRSLPRWLTRRRQGGGRLGDNSGWTAEVTSDATNPDVQAEEIWEDLGQGLDFGEPDAGMIDEWSLVLSSQYVPHRVTSVAGVWRIEVPARHYVRALAEVREYEFEWRDEHRDAPVSESSRPDNAATTVAVVIVFCLWYQFMNSYESVALLGPVDWTGLGAADAVRIRSGEWWRAATALFLHSDAAHLLSNAVIGGFFMVWLNRRIGSWRGWGLTLLSGVLGNLVNAYVHQGQHVSVGASTAVFGAVGIMSGLAVRRGRGLDLRRRLVPAAVGLMLLALLGSAGENTDLGAHLFGFLAGLGLGLLR